MKISRSHTYLVAAALAAAAGCGWLASSSFAQGPDSSGAAYGAQPRRDANPGDPGYGEQLVKAVLASPGVLGIELAQTTKGRRVIFAWFENKRALVDWYQSDFHERGVKWAFPNLKSVREPLPDLPEDSGQILALVTLKFADKSTTGATVSPDRIPAGDRIDRHRALYPAAGRGRGRRAVRTQISAGSRTARGRGEHGGRTLAVMGAPGFTLADISHPLADMRRP